MLVHYKNAWGWSEGPELQKHREQIRSLETTEDKESFRNIKEA
jgi:hypothetical protein